MKFFKIFTLSLSLLLVGAGCATFPYSNYSASFDKSVTLQIGETAQYDDGLMVTLENVDDSRCPEEVQCIWAGELTAAFLVTGGGIGNETLQFQLGTVRTPEREFDGYVFALTSASVSSSGLLVTKNGHGSAINEEKSEGIVVAENVTVSGTFACLPHKDMEGPITLECAFGIRDDEGKYYALDTTGLKNNALFNLSTGSRIVIKGLFTPIGLFEVNRLQKYAIEGVIEVKSVEKAK